MNTDIEEEEEEVEKEEEKEDVAQLGPWGGFFQAGFFAGLGPWGLEDYYYYLCGCVSARESLLRENRLFASRTSFLLVYSARHIQMGNIVVACKKPRLFTGMKNCDLKTANKKGKMP